MGAGSLNKHQSPCDKRAPNMASPNPKNKRPDLTDPAVSKGVGCVTGKGGCTFRVNLIQETQV